MNIKLPKSTILTVLMLLFTCGLFAQSVGDYRSAGNGDWNNRNSWERLNATGQWDTPTALQGYPGQFAGTGAVTVQSGHLIKIGTADLSTISMGTITINGILFLDGPNNTAANFFLNTVLLVVTPNSGVIRFSDKVNLKLPAEVEINVSHGGITGDCSAQQSIFVGTKEIAYCTNNGSGGINFQDIMDHGGYNTAGTLSGNQYICTTAPNNTTTFTSTVSGGTWGRPLIAATIVSINSSTGVITALGAGTATISYSVTFAGKTKTVYRDVFVIATPAAPSSGGNQTVCTDGTTTQTLTATATGGTITWYDAATAGNVVTNPRQVGVGTKTFYAQSSNGNCSSLTRTAVVLTINAAPAAPTSGGNQTVCTDGTTTQTLTATATGGTITWYDAATAGNVVTNPRQVGVGTKTYYAQSFNGTCSSLTRTAVVLAINAAPAAPTTGGNQSVCSDGTTTQTLTATATGGTITWYDAATAGNVVTNPRQVGLGTKTYYAQSSNGTCSSLTRTAVVLTINAALAAPTSGGNQSVCSDGTTTQTLTANATGGTITWYDAATAGNVVTNPRQVGVGTKTYYAQSSNGACSSLTRTAVVLTVNNLPIADAGAPFTKTCTLNPSGATIGVAPVAGVTYSWSPSTGLSSASVSNPTANPTTTTIYTLTATSSGCESVATVTITVPPVVTTTFNGTNWTSPPSLEKIGIIAAPSSAPIFISVDTELCTCTVNSGSVVTVNDNITLKLQDKLVVNGTLTFENNSSLVQINDNAANSGNITYKRTTPTILMTDYVYWSAPVAGATLGNIQTGTLYYLFNAGGNAWARANAGTNMSAGVGYIVRGGGTWFDTGSLSLTPNFIGAPNNGVKTVAIVGGRSNLIGNPYPSAIDADAFIRANTAALSGGLYIWTHKSAIQLASNITNGTAGSGRFAYTSDDYATYNLTGGTGTVAKSDKTGDDKFKPSGKIAAGQAFFAPATAAGGTVTFNNSMRLDGDKKALDNSQFFKPAAGSKTAKAENTNKFEKNRVWLNLMNDEGAFKQTLIGYITGATNENEGGYDGESLNANAFIDFYSINKDKNLAIQGRALPFDDSDTVPLGYKTNIVGEFKIAIDEVDGFLTGKKIILEDKLLNITQDLSLAPYTFTTEKGTFNDRFILSYANKTLATEDFEVVENKVVITNKNKEVKISTPENEIETVFIYDISGRQIYTKTNVDKNELVITTLIARDQILIVKVVLKDKSTVTKKIMY